MFVLLSDLWDTTTRQWNLSGGHIVKQQDFWYVMFMTFWIALPWICTRRVPVEIELVRTDLRRRRCAVLTRLLAAVQQSRCPALRAGNAARPVGADQPERSQGVPRLWHHFVSSACVARRSVHGAGREGTHAKYHYLVCGVQGVHTRLSHINCSSLSFVGDFTRSLVNDPPKYIWTRELKVCLARPRFPNHRLTWL